MKPLWTLHGAGVLLLRDWKSALALIHYAKSPVGLYNEYSLISLTTAGPSVREMLVDSPVSREAGRAMWGFPKELADLQWQSGGSRVTFRRDNKYFRFRACGCSLPVQVRGWTMQVLKGERVRVPLQILGRAGLAFRGKQLALVLPEFELKVFPPVSVTNK